MRKTAYFTICSANYLAYALVLARSLSEAVPGTKLHLFLADCLPAEVAVPDETIDLIQIESLGVDGLLDMAFRYSILEFNTAIKPYCFLHLLERKGFDSAIYVDPDILIVDRLRHVEEALEAGASCILTPHITAGLDDGKVPSEDAYLVCGVFNLGFAAFSDSAESLSFLRWWAGKTRHDCLVAVDRGIFTDQSYCNLAPCFVDRFVSLRNSAYNLAYWNLKQRNVVQKDAGLYVDGEPLRFVHFSGIVPDSPTIFSKHQDRYLRSTIGELRPLTDDYVARLKRSDAFAGGRYSALPYAFGRLQNGDAITDSMRRVYRTFADELSGGNPFELDRQAFLKLDRRFPIYGETHISRVYAAAWESRSDLQRHFDITTLAGQLHFLAWAEDALTREMGFSRDYVVCLSPTQRERLEQVASDAEPQQRLVDTLTERALTSSSFMLRNWLRRQFMGKARLRDYWRRRLYPASTQASTLRNSSKQPPALHDSPTKGLEVFGYLRTETGIGQVARGMVAALRAEGIPFNATALKSPSAFANDIDFPDVVGTSARNKVLICANADNVTEIVEELKPAKLKGRYRIGHWTWELPVFPAAWSAAFETLDEIWTPSRFVARAVRLATRKPVRIVPYVVEPCDADGHDARRALRLPQDACIFLTTFDLNSFPARKNPLATVAAFRDAFPDPEDHSVRLVVKFHGRIDRGQTRARLYEAASADPRISLIDGVYTPQDMVRLRWACDAFVSLHRSEGFGLNIGEAMAAGKLAIATDFSGNRDFLNAANGVPIPYRMRAVAAGEYPFGDGQWWAEPEHEAAVEAMRWAAAHGEAAARLGAQARQDLVQGNAPGAVGRIIREALAGRSAIAID